MSREDYAMSRITHTERPADARGGFTLPEVIMASFVSILVTSAVLSTFIWCMRMSSDCAKIGWSQNEAMRTSQALMDFIRNADRVDDIDQSEGTWVALGFPDGTVATLVYSNAVPLVRDGRMLLQHTNGTETIVARGLTEIMDEGGFTCPIFSRVRPNVLDVAYRVAEPAASGGRDVADDPYAAQVIFSATLRNAEPVYEDH